MDLAEKTTRYAGWNKTVERTMVMPNPGNQYPSLTQERNLAERHPVADRRGDSIEPQGPGASAEIGPSARQQNGSSHVAS